MLCLDLRLLWLIGEVFDKMQRKVPLLLTTCVFQNRWEGRRISRPLPVYGFTRILSVFVTAWLCSACILNHPAFAVKTSKLGWKTGHFTVFYGSMKHAKMPNTTCCVDKRGTHSLPTQPVKLENTTCQTCFRGVFFSFSLRFASKATVAKRNQNN